MTFTYALYPELTRAIAIAVQAHSGATRRDGQPYITHPLAVMEAVETVGQKIVAVLHDVVEDTDITLQDLRDLGISNSRVDMVDAVTKREGEPYEQFLARVKEVGGDAQVVKEADMEHNLATNPHDAKKYIKGLNFLRDNG